MIQVPIVWVGCVDVNIHRPRSTTLLFSNLILRWWTVHVAVLVRDFSCPWFQTMIAKTLGAILGPGNVVASSLAMLGTADLAIIVSKIGKVSWKNPIASVLEASQTLGVGPSFKRLPSSWFSMVRNDWVYRSQKKVLLCLIRLSNTLKWECYQYRWVEPDPRSHCKRPLSKFHHRSPCPKDLRK